VHVRNCLLTKKAHGTNRIVELEQNIDGFYTKTTKRRIQQALCKDVVPIYSIFQHTRPKKKCVFPIAWSSKLGSVGRDFFLFIFFWNLYAPSSKITQTCFFLSYYSLLIIWHAVQCFCYHLCVFSILYFYTWIIVMLKHRSNVQGNKEFQTGNRSLINLFQLNAYQKASISQQSSVYCWSRKRRWISGFCRSIFFFWHRKC
jgi:hypothetical protein